jgi:hypothetical protein
MKSLCVILSYYFLISLALNQNTFAQSNSLFTEVLQKYVKDGLVDYNNLKNDKEFKDYLSQLSKTDPTEFTKDEKLSFWINAYNAFTLQIVMVNYPINSITDLNKGGKLLNNPEGKTVWDKKFISINDKKYSLNDIEHNILRKLDEPRIHFALVCASISCPELRNEAYETKKIDEQLQDETKKFLNDKEKNHYDVKNKKAYISKLFDWFRVDFGDTDKNILMFISDYLPKDISTDISSDVSNWKIKYNNYNWNLNALK